MPTPTDSPDDFRKRFLDDAPFQQAWEQFFKFNEEGNTSKAIEYGDAALARMIEIIEMEWPHKEEKSS